MITVTFIMRDGEYSGFTAQGHAGYAPTGQDIVCAAVSALTQGTISAIGSLTECEAEEVRSIAGDLGIRIRSPDRITQVLLAGLEIALVQLQNEYQPYVQVCRG